MSSSEISPNKRVAEEVPEVVEAKKSKPDAAAARAPVAGEDEEEGEDVGKELKHLDPSNIIEGRRTRGKKIDYAKLEQPESDEDEEEDADVTAPLDDDEEDSDADHNEDED